MINKLYQYFYIYKNHNGLIKIGITQNPASRLQDYIAHRGVTAKEYDSITFPYLFVGHFRTITHFEKTLKALNKEHFVLHDNGWRMEWFKEHITLKDVYNIVIQELNDSRKCNKITEINPKNGKFNLPTLQSGLLTDIQKDPNKFVLSEIF